MTLSAPDKSLLHQHDIAHKAIDGLTVISPDFSFLLHHLDHSERITFEHIPGLERYSDLNIHLLQVRGKRVLVAVGSPSRNLKNKTLPVRIAQQLGVTRGFLFGSARPLRAGNTGFVVIRDHINLLGDNPLIGPNPEAFGTRFPDMTEIYQEEIRRSLAGITGEGNQDGILVARPEPEKLSESEKKALREVGDCYCSVHLVPEAIVARHGNMEFGAIIYSPGDENGSLPEPDITRIFQRAIEQLF